MNKEAIWAIYFSSVTGFQYHPRNPPKERLPIEECAKVADKMMIEHQKRVHQWP